MRFGRVTDNPTSFSFRAWIHEMTMIKYAFMRKAHVFIDDISRSRINAFHMSYVVVNYVLRCMHARLCIKCC